MYLAIFIFFLNIPFGYWRENTKKFSLHWFLAVHIPVPIIVAIRLILGIKLTVPLFLFFVLSYFSGQFLGSIIRKKRRETSC
jgi:hypothetical protein